MNVDAILKVKGDAVVTIRPTATISEALTLLCQKRIGALVVSANGTEPQGILSERDIVHGLGSHGSARGACAAFGDLTRLTSASISRRATWSARITRRPISSLRSSCMPGSGTGFLGCVMAHLPHGRRMGATAHQCLI